MPWCTVEEEDTPAHTLLINQTQLYWAQNSVELSVALSSFVPSSRVALVYTY